MSIKTSKRIALGVIAGLVFAPFAAIAPANAAPALTDIKTVASDVLFPSARVGVAVQVGTTITWAGANVAAEVFNVKSAISVAPSGSTASPALTLAATGNTTGLVAGDIVFAAGTSSSAAGAAITISDTTDTALDETIVFNTTFTPNVAGTYSLITWFDLDNNNAIDAGEKSATKTIVIAADAPAITLSVYGAASTTSVVATTTGTGALIRVNLKNGGEAASLSGLESFTITTSGNATAKARNAADTADLTTLTRASFNDDGYAYLRVQDSAASTIVVTIAGAVGTNVASLTATTVVTFVEATADLASAVAIVNTTGVGGAALAIPTVDATSTMTLTVDPTKTTTVSLSGETGAASEKVTVTITDTAAGDITGLGSATYTFVVTSGTDKKVTISGPAFTPSAATQAFTMAFLNNGTGKTTATVTATASAATTATLDQAATLRVAPGAAVTVSVVYKNAFKLASPNTAVTATVTNRNAHIAVQNLVTDASGRVSFTYTDAPLAGVTLTSDTVTFAFGGVTGVFTINWAALTIGTVKITTPDTTAGVANPIKATPSGINAGPTGASGSVVAVSAAVTEANGAITAGIPVTFTVSGTTAAIPSNAVIAYTDATGKATSSVYGWATGTYTVTATSGGIASTGTIAFASILDTNARVVTATVAGNVVTGKVVDRYGNPVSGVTLYATTTSPANIGGVFTKDVATGNNGTASWVISGFGSVAVSAVNPTSPAGTVFGQTCAAVGFVSCAATAVALVAATTGTATTAETNVGNSFAPVGVASATVTVAAPVVVVPPVVYDNPTLSFVKDGGRVILSGTAVDGEGDIIIYTKKVGTTAWKERAKTLEVAAPGDFNGSIKAPKSNVLVRVKQEGTGQFSNQIIVLK